MNNKALSRNNQLYRRTNTMNPIDKNTLLEHLSSAIEMLADKSLDNNPEATKLAIEKARAMSEVATTYTNVIKTDQEDKRIIIEAMNVAGRWNYQKNELPKVLGFYSDEK